VKNYIIDELRIMQDMKFYNDIMLGEIIKTLENWKCENCEYKEDTTVNYQENGLIGIKMKKCSYDYHSGLNYCEHFKNKLTKIK